METYDDSDIVVISREDVSDSDPGSPSCNLPQSPKIIQEIRDWLDPTSYNVAGGEYRKHLASHTPGTGTWLTSSTKFKHWLDGSDDGLLWLTGIPGSGKSVMAAMLIDRLTRSNPGSPVLFFFFRQIIEANHRPDALLRDWLEQVLDFSPALQRALKPKIGQTMTMEDMWRFLRLAFAGLPNEVFCVADALDEMGPGQDDFIKALASLGQWKPGKVKVLITSRPVVSVERPLHTISCLHLRLREDIVDVDISTYVLSQLSSSAIPRDQWQMIIDAVPGRANGLFLYAKLAMDAFLSPGADVQAVLDELPANLGVLYTDLLRKHALASGIDPSVQHLLLQTVTHTSRPLRLLELAELIRATFKVQNGDRLMAMGAAKDLARTACGPLLEILPDETVSVIHHSFTEYLKGTIHSDDDSRYPILEAGVAHAQLALSCLRYMQTGFLDGVGVAEEDSSESDRDSDDEQFSRFDRKWSQLRLAHPLFDYSSKNWSWHMANSEDAGHDQAELNAEVRRLLSSADRIKALEKVGVIKGIRRTGDDMLLHLTAERGLLSLTRELLHSGVHADARDSDRTTALWRASLAGHTDIVRELLAAGANPGTQAEWKDRDRTPLHVASHFNNRELVSLLLENGVDPLTGRPPAPHPDGVCRTVEDPALRVACHKGHVEAVEVFLPFINSDTNILYHALHWACLSGRARVVEMLVHQPGIDVNQKLRGDTLLFSACHRPDLSTIRALITAGADPTIECGQGWEGEHRYSGSSDDTEIPSTRPRLNALHLLCSKASDESFSVQDHLQPILNLFLQAGADINQTDSTGQTALHKSFMSPLLIRLLLDAGADANRQDAMGCSPLHLAELPDVAALLLEQGNANINAIDGKGKTPLLTNLAVDLSSRHNEMASKLLEYGPDGGIVDHQGNSCLHYAVSSWHIGLTVIKTLIERGADPNLKNHDCLSPLLFKSTTKVMPADRMDILLSAGADINSTDDEGSTLLFRTLPSCIHPQGRKILSDLIERGTSVHARDFRGRTILHELVRVFRTSRAAKLHSFFTSLVEFFIDKEVDVKAVDRDGNGILHELARRCARRTRTESGVHNKGVILIWNMFMDKGLSMNQKNHAGRIPLHILCSRTDEPAPLPGRSPNLVGFALSHTNNIDARDNHGVTPLHVAATACEIYVKHLLDAGADPTHRTRDGLTALHLAARSRQSNIVGLLLSVLAKDFQFFLTPAVVPGVNVEAYSPREELTPLFYGCRSGRPETVDLLLAAGAEIGSALKGCLEYEDEAVLWKPNIQKALDASEEALRLRADDESRPSINASHSALDRQHLIALSYTDMDEILGMLVHRGADLASIRGHPNSLPPVVDALGTGHFDTVTSFGKVFDINQDEKSGVPRFFAHLESTSQEATARAVRDFDGIKHGESNQSVFLHLLHRKQSHLVEELARAGADFLVRSTDDRSCNFQILVRQGYTQLVEAVGTIEMDKSFEKGGDWHAFGDKSRPGLWSATQRRGGNRFFRSQHDDDPHFLLAAVLREMPNLKIVKLLVEKFAVNINQLESMHDKMDDLCWPVQPDSALHAAAQGKNWWHAHQALPYLIQAGAQVDLRDGQGRTPLHHALHSANVYALDAARILLEAGADASALDSGGNTCFDHSRGDTAKLGLLLDHSPHMGVDAVRAAILARDVTMLQAVLSRQPELASGHGLSEEPPEGDYSTHCPPLWQAAIQIRGQSPSAIETQIRVIKVLLDHGANPLAEYWESAETKHRSIRYSKVVSNRVGDYYRVTTILHELVVKNGYVDVLLNSPGLDINRRDPEGCTLLHTACLSSHGPDYIGLTHDETATTIFQRLISLGAEMNATDDGGRNVLHHMLEGRDRRGDPYRCSMSLAEVLRVSSQLVNQPDDEGRTPLLDAAQRTVKHRDPEMLVLLLQNGGDPTVAGPNGNNLLHILARKLHLNPICTIFRELVAGGANINGRNQDGQTPLFSFATGSLGSNDDVLKGEEGLIAMLEQIGADFFVQDNEGRGLLHVAAKGDAALFRELMDLGLDPLVEDSAHQTAIDVTAAYNNTEVLELFKAEK